MSWIPEFEYPLWTSIAFGCGIIYLISRIGKRWIPLTLPNWARFFALLFIFLALAGPTENFFPNKETITVLVDVSESISRRALLRNLDLLFKELEKSNRSYEIVSFSDKPSDGAISRSRLESIIRDTSPTATDIEAALRSELRGGASQIILVSDGIETKGDYRKVISELKKRKIALYPFFDPAFQITNDGVELKDLHLPLYVAPDEEIRGHVSLVSESESEVSGTLFTYKDGKLVRDEKITCVMRNM